MNLRALVASLCLALTACLPQANGTTVTPPGAVPSNLVLRSYEVPNNGAQRLRGVLKELLWFGSDSKDANKYVGRADVGPDGRLIVLAPESVQEGVKALVASVTANPVKEPGTVRLDYWVVSGAEGNKGGSIPSAMQEISPALAELEKNDGPMSFTLIEKLSVSSLSGERGRLNGRDTSVRQFTTVVDGRVVSDLELERFGQKLETRVRLVPGQIAVLASSGAPLKDGVDSGRSVYFLVRAANDGDGR